jgi:hemoglobin/transferrin/lactoferrin receptor protein
MRLSIIAVLFLASLTAGAQIITLKDKITQQILPGATIRTDASPLLLNTNAKGQVYLSNLQGVATINIFNPGYKSQVIQTKTLNQPNTTIYMEESNISLDNVVVSASRWTQPKRNVPNRIITIQQKDVLFQNPQTTADLLANSGEVYIQKSQMSGGSPMIRGFATNRVLITVDGVRMNTAIFRSGNLQNLIAMDALSTERVEVLFGPGSVMYGSDAIGGVMNFTTLLPRLSSSNIPEVSANAMTRYSSANQEFTGHVDLRLGLKKWAFVTSVSHSDFKDLKMGSKGPADYLRPEYVETINGIDTVVPNPDPEKQVPTGYTQLNMMQKVLFSPSENLTLNYGIHYSTSSDNPRYDNLLRYRNNRLRSSEWYYGPQRWLMNNFGLVNTCKTSLYDALKIGLAHQFFEESRHDRNFGAENKTNNLEKVNAYSVNIDLEKSLAQKHSLFYGLEMIYNKVGSTGTIENIKTNTIEEGPGRYPSGSDWSSYGAFITYSYKASDKLSVQAGTRFNQFIINAEFNDRFYPFPFKNAHLNQGALTGSLGAVYAPDASWQLSTNFSTGFRAPNIDDMGKIFESTPGSVVVPNPTLGPEYAYNGEIGVAKLFGTTVKVDVSTYYTHLDNALVRRDFTLNGSSTIVYDGEVSQVQAIQNAANAHVWGLQAGLEINLPAGVGLMSRFNYQNGKEELDNGSKAPLRHAAPWFGTTHLTYSKRKFKADVYAFYNGEVSFTGLAPSEKEKTYMYASDKEGNPYSPGWLTLNMKVLYQLSSHLTLNGGLENITDKRYRQYSSGIAAPGRNFIVSLSASL